MNFRATASVVALLLGGVGLTACGSSSNSSAAGSPGDAGGNSAAQSSSAVAAQAPNPVDVLKKIPDCQLAAGETVGDHDGQGDRYASCTFMDNQGTEGTTVTVYTAAGRQPNVPELVTDDSHKIVKGSNFVLEITGVWSAYSAHINPQDIASEVGGQVQS